MVTKLSSFHTLTRTAYILLSHQREYFSPIAIHRALVALEMVDGPALAESDTSKLRARIRSLAVTINNVQEGPRMRRRAVAITSNAGLINTRSPARSFFESIDMRYSLHYRRIVEESKQDTRQQ